MASDSIANASSIPIGSSSNHREFAKKKRANRSAKLKQCKLDARREQWLSQVMKNKGSKEEGNGRGGTRGESMQAEEERGRSVEKLEIKPRSEEENQEGLMNNYSDTGSPSNSPTSHTSSVLGSNDSGMNFTGSSSSSSSSNCSNSSVGCCSGCISEEDEEGDDDCLDDWEAVADALAAADDVNKQYDPNSDLLLESNEDVPLFDSRSGVNNQTSSVIDVSESKQEGGVTVQRASASNVQAWRPNDAFRPQSLPNLSKQSSFPMKLDRHFGGGGSVWGSNAAQVPSSCPICYEDLDLTDTSFLPCSCGFRLCLFCHKRILEEDGRCPGCRKHYDYKPVEGEATLEGGSLTFRLGRSHSNVTRS